MDINVNFGANMSIARCIKNHKPLAIVPMFANNNRRYFIFDRENRLFGAFNFDDDGILSNVKFDNASKTSRVAVDAILSMRDFILKKAKAKNADCVEFSILADKKNVNKLKRLFSKFDVTEAGFVDGVLKFIGVLNPKKEFEIMSSIGKKTSEIAPDALRAIHISIDA